MTQPQPQPDYQWRPYNSYAVRLGNTVYVHRKSMLWDPRTNEHQHAKEAGYTFVKVTNDRLCVSERLSYEDFIAMLLSGEL